LVLSWRPPPWGRRAAITAQGFANQHFVDDRIRVRRSAPSADRAALSERRATDVARCFR
jgi:hypothetical protein